MTARRYTVADIPDGSDAQHGAHVATGYYSGAMSALYALTSTGSLELYPGEGLGRIRREVAAAITDAHPDDIDALRAFAAWLAGVTA